MGCSSRRARRGTDAPRARAHLRLTTPRARAARPPQVLCDRSGLMASYQSGLCTRGAHAHHCWNSMIVDGAYCVVDLMHEPGAVYPEGSDAARRYMRVDEFAFASLQSTFAKRTGPMPAGTAVDATSAKRHANELFPTGAAPF